ncbi:replication restart helicase PriA [Megalodesulfovibrio gigas]|uniref:replication restart helicase PriA n=1 Tax=Megalodesulfovibrio gigas TaxID=879 RepID=UPI0004296DB4|nr:primosomal protein N' [Megalodesulfovibrio gigas]
MNAQRAALLSPPFLAYHYRIPDTPPAAGFLPGMRVAVPLGNTVRAAVLLPQDAGWDTAAGTALTPPEGIALKPVAWPLERVPLFSAAHLDVLRQLALRQGMLLGQVLASVLPAGLKVADIRYRLQGIPKLRSLRIRDVAAADAALRQTLSRAWEAGAMQPEAAFRETQFCWLSQDPPWPVRPAAVNQLKILEYLWEHGPVPVPVLLAALGDGVRESLRRLVDVGLVRQGLVPPGQQEEEMDPACVLAGAPPPPTLNEEQAAALASLSEALHRWQGETRLLYGVTGSGKTTVYLALARECLRAGRSVVLLAPEIALACNLRSAAAQAFPEAELIFHHGSQTPARREAQFRKLAGRGEGDAPVIVVGARSALFLPLHDLGLIVLDEEHDASFKQEERLPYQAKELGYVMARRFGALLLLGSATPDIKSFHAAQTGALPMAGLTRRHGGAQLPAIEFVDIKGLSSFDQLLAPQTMAMVEETVRRGEQAIILLNRRGYAPAMYCQDCGHVLRCPQCQIGLTYHKGRERMLCHYCGEGVPWPCLCPQCGGISFLPLGEGTQRMEEVLTRHLGRDTTVLRLDRDAARRPGRLEEILSAFARKEAQVLVGTQMLSKGHDFPDVTQVVVADADMGLNLPDFRAAERTFQLLMQVSGRAGRGDKPGRVAIQTRDASHYCFEHLKTHDYQGFFEEELARRKKWRYPPFVKLGLVRVSFPAEWEGHAAALAALAGRSREAGREHGVQVMGPAPAPLPMLQGRKRFHLLFKGEDWSRLRAVFAALKPLQDDTLRLTLDLDPLDMM